MKIVYLWKDGHQVLVFPNDEGEYVYPTENWTEQAPPEGIYAPFYYDGQKWIGQSKEDFEKTLPKEEPDVDEKDLAISQLTSTVAELTNQVELLQTGMAQIIEQHANIELEAK
ncbi:hypothetical protein [Staphylococcus warneri]|uniref:hypothetical protein n=1 Tax=Staphylococcus warneri TaxID=1292 RepID=UPI000D1D34D4|nr:hypothetical protein [Staphylococcus warneri]PTI20876.1 hypothetical protein BU082_02995 [Staphylococcus warneri]PTI26918.1 hypothetical protein BU081_01260 [Staphylococcus warneri]RIM99645.1 hypothetical protein BU093_03135 [Staphylococcus warneri]RIN05592.1 hypothetical protein BU092_05180 [Staphylococcus warneri]